jgi:hypothetical protein
MFHSLTKVEKDKGNTYVFPDERRQLVAQSGYLVTKREFKARSIWLNSLSI